MQILFKKHSVLYFLLAIIFSVSLFSSCDTKKEDTNGQSTEENQEEKEDLGIDKNLTLESSQFLKEENKITSPKASDITQKQTEQSFQEAKKVISINSLKTKKEDEKTNTYLKKIAQLTQLDENKIVEIKNKKGFRELEKIITTLPENDSKKEAQRLTMLMRLNRVALSEEAKQYLLTQKNDTLSEKEQIKIYLDAYIEAAFLYSNFGEKIELNTEDFKKSKQLAKLTQIDVEKFVLIESQLGVLGLHSAILNIPSFPNQEEALKIISK